jgi:hypothetical protein
VSERQRILISPFPGSNPGTPASQPRSLRCDFLVCENRRHSGGLGWRGRVSGRQFPAFRSRSGAFRGPVSLGVTAAKPSAVPPDVPPIAAVLPGYRGESWLCVYVPAKTSAPIVARLREIVQQAISAHS